MATTADMAKKYNKTADEIKQALVEIGSASAAVRVFKVTPEMERDLDAHFMAAAQTNRQTGGATIGLLPPHRHGANHRKEKTHFSSAGQTVPFLSGGFCCCNFGGTRNFVAFGGGSDSVRRRNSDSFFAAAAG